MLLETILRKIYSYCEDANNFSAMVSEVYFRLAAMLELLIDMMPKSSKKPFGFYMEYDYDTEQVIFYFEYDTDHDHDVRMNYDELYQYFTTVLQDM